MRNSAFVILLAGASMLFASAVSAGEGVETKDHFGRKYTIEAGVGLPYTVVGVGGEWFAYSTLSFFGAFIAQDGLAGLSGGVRLYPFGHDAPLNPYAHGFAGGLYLSFVNNEGIGITYGGGGGGLEWLFGEESLMRLGVDYGCARFGCGTLPHLTYGRRF